LLDFLEHMIMACEAVLGPSSIPLTIFLNLTMSAVTLKPGLPKYSGITDFDDMMKILIKNTYYVIDPITKYLDKVDAFNFYATSTDTVNLNLTSANFTFSDAFNNMIQFCFFNSLLPQTAAELQVNVASGETSSGPWDCFNSIDNAFGDPTVIAIANFIPTSPTYPEESVAALMILFPPVPADLFSAINGWNFPIKYYNSVGTKLTDTNSLIIQLRFLGGDMLSPGLVSNVDDGASILNQGTSTPSLTTVELFAQDTTIGPDLTFSAMISGGEDGGITVFTMTITKDYKSSIVHPNVTYVDSYWHYMLLLVPSPGSPTIVRIVLYCCPYFAVESGLLAKKTKQKRFSKKKLT